VAHAGLPLHQARGVVLMMHGRNASSQNILELAAPLHHEAFAYLAPAAAGSSWYPKSFLSPTAENEPGLSSALGVIRQLVDLVGAAGVPPARVVLLGFSQGACLAGEFAVRHANRYGGLVMFSGGLIGPPGTTWEAPGAFNGTPVFLGCSDVDAHIPKARVEESAAVFARMGAAVTIRLYAGMGHTINDDEIAEARAIMDAAIA
jgi:predicted esterase